MWPMRDFQTLLTRRHFLGRDHRGVRNDLESAPGRDRAVGLVRADEPAEGIRRLAVIELMAHHDTGALGRCAEERDRLGA